MGISAWTRSDSLLFNIVGLAFLLYHFRKTLLCKELVIYSVLAFTPFIAWIIYSSIFILLDQDVFVNALFIDNERISLILFWLKILFTNTQQYGITFYSFIIIMVLNLKNLKSDISTKFLLILLISWFIYTFMYYQMDPEKMGSTLEMIMKASYKRGLFIFIPLVWFYIAINKFSIDIFRKINNFLLVDKQSA